MKAKSYISFKDVKRVYHVGETTVNALRGINFEINAGELVVITGQSGAGKTTLLNILGGMDIASSGEIYVDGKSVHSLKPTELTVYRRHDVGFVFQFYNLMPNLTAIENVELAAELCKNALDSKLCLEKVGLGERLYNFPSQLSGGEQQRVAIARAVAKNPKLLLCDEPTGALDYNTGKNVLEVLQNLCRNDNKTVIIVTHNSALKEMADRVLEIKNGQVAHQSVNSTPKLIKDIEW